jgi:hypothetical protein
MTTSDNVKMLCGVVFLIDIFVYGILLAIGPMLYRSGLSSQTEEQKKNEQIYNNRVHGICISILVIAIIIFCIFHFRKQN